MEGWIKLHRQILDCEFFAHPVGLKIWVWCLLKASSKKRFVSLKIGKGCITVEITPGQFIFGRHKAEEELNIDGSTVYKWMKKLEEKGMILIVSNNQYSVITICNWATYQENESQEEQPKNNQRTTKEQPKNNLRTTKEHKQEGKESKESKKGKEEHMGKFFASEKPKSKETSPSLEEVRTYFSEKGYRDDIAVKAWNYYEAGNWHDINGNKVRSWKQKMQSVWMKDEYRTQQKPHSDMPVEPNRMVEYFRYDPGRGKKEKVKLTHRAYLTDVKEAEQAGYGKPEIIQVTNDYSVR
jgi:hypothetical protein